MTNAAERHAANGHAAGSLTGSRLQSVRTVTKALPTLLIAAVTLVCGLPPLHAQLVPIGEEFQVNSQTTGDQYRPAIGAGDNGEFVVVWERSVGHGIVGQRFANSGDPLGSELQVSTRGRRPAVAAASNGDFFVTFLKDDNQVFAQRFASNGSPQGTEFQVNTDSELVYWTPAIAAGNGSFVVAWRGYAYGEPGTDGGYAVFGRRYTTNGSPLGSQFRINTSSLYPLSGYGGIDVAAAGNDDFVIVWDGYKKWEGYGNGYRGIFGRRYDNSGAALGSEFRVAIPGYEYEHEYAPAVSVADNGDFVVVWSHSNHIFGQRFASSGSTLGTEFEVNATSIRFPPIQQPDIAMSADGDFMVVWSNYPFTGDAGPFGRYFASSGAPLGPDFLVGASASGAAHATHPAVAATGNGEFTVVWEDDRNRQDIFGQQFGPAPPPLCGAHPCPSPSPSPSPELGPAPPPLYGAHGFMGNGGALDKAFQFARTLVPSLRETDMVRPDVAPNKGVLTNAWKIIAEVEDLTRGHADPRANVIAHSKGGLDTRLAMQLRPELFKSLAMLATPNGGSRLADLVCAGMKSISISPDIPGIPDVSLEDFITLFDPLGTGDCGPDSALWNLTTIFTEQFNRLNEYALAWHDIGVAAGACGGATCLALNFVNCGGNINFLCAPPFSFPCTINPIDPINANPGDKYVCVDSAFKLVETSSGPSHQILANPEAKTDTFSADHTEMREKPCPISRALAFLYGSSHNVGNPWIDGDGSGCEDLMADSSLGNFAAAALQQEELATPGPIVVYGMQAVVSEDDVTELALDAGDDQIRGVFVIAPSRILLTGELRSGSVAVGVLERVLEGGFYFATASEGGPAPTTLHLAMSEAAPIGVVTFVEATFELSAEAVATAPEIAEVTITGAGLPPGSSFAGEVLNVSGRPDVIHEVAFGVTVGADGRAVATAQIPVPAGQAALYMVRLTEPASRMVLAGTTGMPGGGEIGDLVGEDLVDQDGDRVLDTLQLTFEFTALGMGSGTSNYMLGLDIASSDGELITGAAGWVTDTDGSTTTIDIDVPVAFLILNGASGPLQLRNGLLVDLDRNVFLASKEHLGQTSSIDISALTPPGTLLGRARARLDADGTSTAVVFETTAVLLDDRDYAVEAIIFPASGPSYGVSEVVGGAAGRHVATFVVDSTQVAEAGAGIYSLQSLEIRAADGTRVLADAPGASIEVPVTTLCPTVPRAGCRTAGISKFAVRDKSPEKRLVSWKWARGTAPSLEFGDPLTTTRFAFCVFGDTPSVDGLVLDVDLAPGAGWTSSGRTGSTLRYTDRTATQKGVQRVILKGDKPGKDRVLFKAKGAALPLPGQVGPQYFNTEVPVTVQLINDDGGCWESVFQEGDVRTNIAGRFKASAKQ